MNHLMAKIKLRNKNVILFRKIISDKTIFSSINLDDSVEYSPTTLLENGQWYVISDFTLKEYCRFAFLKYESFDSVDYEQLSIADFEKLDFLFSYQNGVYFFQNISKSQLIRKKMLSFGEQFRFDDNNASIIIKEIPDAIYIKETDRLFFRKLSSITSIFHGIDQLHREATEPETVKFLSQDFITLSDGFTSNSVKTANRKRIALALDTLNNLKNDDKKAVFSYIKDYCPDLSISEESFSVASELDLKMVLFGIEQRFYTTPIGDEKRIANSIMTMSNTTNKSLSENPDKIFSFS